MSRMSSPFSSRVSRTATAGMGLALLAVALMLGGFAGLSAGVIATQTGFGMFLGGAALGFVALAVSIMGWRQTRMAPGRNRAWAGIIVSSLIIALMAPQIRAALSVPPIHDITTDTDNPPVFVDVLALRADAPNTADYGGETLAALQKAAYPGIAPLLLPISPAEAFARAQKTVEARGWSLVAANAEQGRIEATAQTRNMHFKDDVVIRITPGGGGSRIDMRSVSRFGKSDLGVNAERIAAFLKDLKSP